MLKDITKTILVTGKGQQFNNSGKFSLTNNMAWGKEKISLYEMK